MNNILSKEDFCNIIRMIEAQSERTEKFNAALAEMCDGYVLFDVDNGYLTAALRTLSIMFGQTPGDECNCIEYYLYENSDKNHCSYFEDYEICVNTPELLYEELMSEIRWMETQSSDEIRKFYHTYGHKINSKEEKIMNVGVGNNGDPDVGGNTGTPNIGEDPNDDGDR